MNPERIINEYNMLPSGSRVLCALSGGVDSVVLTHYLATNAKRMGITVAAAHFSHGIRKDAAKEEKELCQKLCDKLGIELFFGEGDSVTFAKTQKIGLEEAARKLRYDFLSTCAETWGAQKVATAHHCADNVETVIMNACRGAGTLGLSGIPPVRDKFIRPLLYEEKEDILQYANANDLQYAVDQTNLEACCRRNEIRILLLPEIKAAFPRAESVISRFSACARRANAEINCKAKELYNDAITKQNEAFILAELLLWCEKAVAFRVFEKMYQAAGGRFMLSLRHLEELYKLCTNPNPSVQISLPGLIALRRYEYLVFKKAVCTGEVKDIIIGIGESADFGAWNVEIADGAFDNAIVLDKSSLSFPLVVRSRKSGDRIYVNGCTKTFKKLMIEKKVPKEERNTWPVMFCGDRAVCSPLLGYDTRLKYNCAENPFSVIFRRIEK